MILTVVFYLFVVFTAIQITYYITFSSILFKPKKRKKNIEQVPVSVIVYAKNNATELKENLPFILAQAYSSFEIVVVNNASSDDTTDVMEVFAEKHNNIKNITVENNEAFWNNKKYALTLGIKAAKHDHLLFTNAFSEPNSEQWITEMIKNFSQKRTIVIGYGKIKKENTFTNLLVRFHHLYTAIKCFSFAKSGVPFMAFGSNLAYKRSEFFKVNGFINHIKLKYGVDNLFIRDAATKENITFTISKNSFIENDAPKSFKEWFYNQRITSSLKEHYKSKHRFLLSFFVFTKAMFYLLAIVLFFFYPWKIILAFVLAYFLIQYLVIGFSAKKLKEVQLIFFLPFLEISLLLIQISIFIANLISKPNYWR